MATLLETITRIESHASQRGGVESVGSLLGNRLAAVGFDIDVVPQPGAPSDLEWVAEIMSPGVDYSSLGDTYVARRDGTGNRRLLLLGDLDTAFAPGSTEAFPFTVDGDIARGPGIADMKGGLVVLMAAIEALHRFEIPAPPITVVLSGDEQAGSLGSRSTVEQEARECTWCFCVECARQGGRLMGARGHVGVGRLVVTGREAYGGDPTDRGINAIEGISHIVPAIQQLAEPARGIFVSVNLLAGGRRRSVIPSIASAVLDLRTPGPKDWEIITTRLSETVTRATSTGEASLQVYSHRPAVEWTTVTDRMLDYLRQSGRSVGVPVEALSSPAAGSSAFAAAAGAITFDGMGPVGGRIMTREEHVLLSSIPERAALLARSVAGLLDLSSSVDSL